MDLLETQLLDVAPVAMVVVDQSGNIVLANQRTESLFGYKREELLDESIEVLLPERLRISHPALRATLFGESSEQTLVEGTDLFGRHKSGTEFPIEISLNSIDTERGPLVVSAIRDITQRIANEKAIQKVKDVTDQRLAIESSNQLAAATQLASLASASRDRLALILENSVNEIYVSDAVTYRVLDANRAARDHLGYSVEETQQLMPWDFVVGLNSDNIEELIAPLREGKVNVVTIETIHRRKDGSTYPVSVNLQYMAALSPAVFTAIAQDITDLKQQEKTIQLRDRAIEALDVGVSITDATQEDYPFVYVNKALCELTGYSPAELLGQGVRMLQKNDPAQPEHFKIQEAQARGESVQVNLKSTRKDGSQYTDEVSTFPVYDAAGDVTHYIGINRDVTSAMQTQAKLQQAQKIEAIGQLSGGIAHDFNNLLSVIIWNLEFLSAEITDEALRLLISEADSAAQMGARLTRRLLAFARQSQLEPEVLNVNDHALSSIDLLRSTIGETISLSVALEPDIWSVRADPSEIENAVVNLCLNARDAMLQGGKITIATKNVVLPNLEDDFNVVSGEYVKLSVTDNGSGMTEEVKSRIFDPFFTTKVFGKGTGLGLAMIHGFVTQSGGYIRVSSEVGHGTVINLYLPKYSELSAAEELDGPVKVNTDNSGARILVVEDNDAVRAMMVKRLQSLGFNTEDSGNGVKAIRYLENNADIDLVLTDIVMEGGVSGYDLAQWIQSNLPQCKILLTSGFNPEIAEVKDLDAAKLQVLPKPHRLAELQQAVNSILENTPEDV